MDHPAFSAIYKAHVDSLYSYGIGLGYSHDACLDAIQDVFYKLYCQKFLVNVDNIRFYLLRSLKNRLIDMQKATKKEITHHDIGGLPFSVEVSVKDHVVDREDEELIKNKVETLLNLLTDRQREAIYLRYMQELEYEEIGKLLNMSAESVRKLVHRGIEKIRQNTNPDTFGLALVVLATRFFH